MTLSEYIAEWDPAGFISDLGAPRDEYGLEVAELKLKYRTEMSDAKVAELICKVFEDLLEMTSPAFKAECQRRAPEIHKLLAEDHYLD